MMSCCKYSKEISCSITFITNQIVCGNVSYRYGSCLVKLVKSIIAVSVRCLNN